MLQPGGRLYRSHCANCHGAEGEGGRGPGLTAGRFRRGSSDQDLYSTISDGIPGTEMPGAFFEGRQLWQIVAFVRSLSKGTGTGQLPGDPTQGARIFRKRGGCLQCHMVGGEGGRSGPSLDDIGAFRSASHLKTAILEPGEQVLPVHWMARAVTASGETISGRRLNEDSYSIQLLDSKDRLISLDRSKLKSYDVSRESAMPSYQGVLDDEEVDDLVAYLASLRLGGVQ